MSLPIKKYELATCQVQNNLSAKMKDHMILMVDKKGLPFSLPIELEKSIEDFNWEENSWNPQRQTRMMSSLS